MTEISEEALEKERKEILNAYKGLLRSSKGNRTPEKTRLIRKAFNVALDAHKNDRRKSGEPYIYHPIAVARICSEEMGLGSTSIVCALLHDTVEDTHITLTDVEELFGIKVRTIIDGLTKIPDIFDHTSSIQAENFRKMLLTISDDLRVILIKLADRLHNMRTLGSMRSDKQLKIASETQYLYAPLAHRMGLYSIKNELEDLAFKYKEPDIYEMIEAKLEKTRDVRNRFIRSFSNPIRLALEQQNYSFEIKARTKSISSIWRKMQIKNIPFEEVYDVFAIRLIVNSNIDEEKTDCWRVYSIVTDFYQPNPDRLRDWVSTPKANGYESLHTTVMSPSGKWVEVQIRTKRMDEVAEKGYAAHWKYKESKDGNSKFDRWINEVRSLLDSSDEDAIDFVDEFKLNLFDDEIYVFTPKGELKTLPSGATTLDFAFDIHTDIGMQCIGAKVNNKLMPLSYQLNNGDQIEIITSSKQKPKEDWLKMAVTAKARQKIKNALNEEVKKVAEDGKEILKRKFNHFKVKFNSENISFLERFFNYNSTTDLYFHIAKGKVNLTRIRNIKIENGQLLINKERTEEQEDLISRINTKKETVIIGEEFNNIDYKLARCCSPIPGDKIFGFITINEGIKIHRTNCPNATQMMSNYAYRIIQAKWKSDDRKERLCGLKIKGIDDLGLVNRVTSVISKDLNINMKSISFESKDGIFIGKIIFFIRDIDMLDNVIEKFESIEGIKTSERINVE